MKNKYEKITEARKRLGIGTEATIDEIKDAFHDLIRQTHPDKTISRENDRTDEAAEIIKAYKILMNYCREYKISFSKQEVDRYKPAEELWWDQFGDDPMWGV